MAYIWYLWPHTLLSAIVIICIFSIFVGFELIVMLIQSGWVKRGISNLVSILNGCQSWGLGGVEIHATIWFESLSLSQVLWGSNEISQKDQRSYICIYVKISVWNDQPSGQVRKMFVRIISAYQLIGACLGENQICANLNLCVRHWEEVAWWRRKYGVLQSDIFVICVVISTL